MQWYKYSLKSSPVAGTGKRESCQETEIKNEVQLNNKFKIAGLFIQNQLKPSENFQTMHNMINEMKL